MIILKIVTGPYAGTIRTSEDVAKKGVDPAALLVDMAKRDCKWIITYPDEEGDGENMSPEHLEWRKADLVGRIYSAAIDKRAIVFSGRIWLFPDFDDLDFPNKMKELEDELGRCEMIRLRCDNALGLQIDSIPRL